MSTLHEVSKTQQSAEKPLSEVLHERRATQNFESTPIPDHDLAQILRAGLAAPSGYNMQPWRFVVVREPQARKRLRQAAMGQPKVEEAPVVVVACGDTRAWKDGDLEKMIKMGNEHGFPESSNEGARKGVTGLLSGGGGTAAGIDGDLNIWVNRHVMIAYTTMMWMAEVLGYDTAPMEGFFEDKVRQVLGIPEHVKVVALLAIGRAKPPDKLYGGRFEMEHTVFDGHWGKGMKIG